MFDRLDDILIHYEEIMQELGEPNVTENQTRFRKLMKEQADLAPLVEAYKAYKQAKQDIEDSLALLEEESDEDMRELAKEVAKEQDLTLREGVYMYFPGPQFETPAEVRAARVLGADAVGMSTVPEAIAAAHCGYEILGVTLCANMAAGVLPQPLSGEEVNEMAEQSAPHFSSLILGCLERL